MFQSLNIIKEGVGSWWIPFLNSIISRHVVRVVPEYTGTSSSSPNQKDLKAKTVEHISKPEPDLYNERIMEDCIIPNRLHKDMPKLHAAKQLKVDTSFTYDDDSDIYSELSIPLYNSCNQSERSDFIVQPFQSITSTFPHFGTDYHLASQSAETLNDDYGKLICPSTAMVSFCSEGEADSLPASPRPNAFHWTELNTQTPACSPMAGLSCKPIPVRLTYHLYRGMLCTANTTVAPAALPVLSWQS